MEIGIEKDRDLFVSVKSDLLTNFAPLLNNNNESRKELSIILIRY